LPEGKNQGLDRGLVRLAVILLTGAMAVVFDTTIVNVALATLSRDLHVGIATTQWVVTAYVLALAMVVPVSGWAMHRFGGRRVWLFSLALFLAGSILSSLSWNMPSLVAFRVLQGVGGGLMLPLLQTLLVEAAGGRALGRLMAVVGLPIIIGPVLGPVIGGLIVSHASWRWMFWVNVPFCVAGLILAWRGLRDDGRRERQRLDVWGLALLSPAVALLIYGLSQVAVKDGLTHAVVIVPLAAGLALLTLFVRHALRAGSEPIIDLRLFRRRSFSASGAFLFLSGLTLYGAMLLLPLYYQELRGQSALTAGLLLAPQGLGMLLTRGWAGRATDRLGARPIVLGGLVLAFAGTFAYTQAGLHTNELVLGLALVVRGAGLGAATIPIMATAYFGLTGAEIAHASSATRILQQLGGSFGAAVVGVILQTQVNAHALAAPDGLALAYRHTFWWTLALTATAFVPALILPSTTRVRDRATAERAEGTSRDRTGGTDGPREAFCQERPLTGRGSQ
jgi:EmrB/QacA subfamily drug resistance transporter